MIATLTLALMAPPVQTETELIHAHAHQATMAQTVKNQMNVSPTLVSMVTVLMEVKSSLAHAHQALWALTVNFHW